jgi:hypothetical protein
MTCTDRRRNAYADICYVCGTSVAVGAGWLYASTKPNRAGRFTKRAKCDRCHTNKLTHKWQVANLDNPAPAVRRWSVSDVNRWTLEIEAVPATWCGEYREGTGYEPVAGTLVVVHVSVNGERVELAGGDRILNRQQGPWYGYEDKGIGGRSFTPAAWKRLVQRVGDAIAAHKQD